MSGHEFEKQVRQKLNDLKVTPSAESWENIEGRLRERKRRPVVFYWLPLLLIGLAAGGYFLLNNDHLNNNQRTVLSEKNSTHNDHNVTVQPETSYNDDHGKNDHAKNDHAKNNNENNKNNNTTGSTSSGTLQQKPRASGIVLHDAPQFESNKQSTSPGFFRNVKPEIQTGREEKSDLHDNVTAVDSRKQPNTQLNSTIVTQEKNAAGKSISLKIANYPVGAITASPLNFTQAPINTPVNKTKKWSFGISAFAGISAVNEGHLLNFNNAVVEDVSLVPSFAPRPSFKPSSISPGIAYSGGLFVKRELNRKFSLTMGVNYLQLNTRSKVGNREYGSQVVNAGASGYQFVYNYFRVERDKPTAYHNRYHFIEVPLELHTKLNRSAKMPIQVTTGMAVSQLLQSNSLHFDGTTGVYYKDDRLLNQTQVAAKAGVSVGILNKTKRPLWIGPSARYNISKILEKDVSAKTNFMSVGVDVKMFIR